MAKLKEIIVNNTAILLTQLSMLKQYQFKYIKIVIDQKDFQFLYFI